MDRKYRKFENVTPQRSKNMSRIKGKDTSIEIKLRKALWKKGYRYRKNYKGLPGRPDICITKYKIAIFCDSEFFHGKDWKILRPKVVKGNNGNYWGKKIDENIKRDLEIDKELLTLGWTIIHFWGQEINEKIDECVKTVTEIIEDIEISNFEIMDKRV